MSTNPSTSEVPDVSTAREFGLGLYLRGTIIGVALAAAGIAAMFAHDTAIGHAMLLLASGVVLAVLCGLRARALLNGVDAAPVNASPRAQGALPRRATAF
jgi:hypothetical protein